MGHQQIVFACRMVLILIILKIILKIPKIILKNVIGAPHEISVTADQNKDHSIARNANENEEHNFALNMYQQKEHNIARNKAPKFPPFFFGLVSALAVQALIALCDPTLLGTRYFPEDHLYTITDPLHSLRLAFTAVIFVPIFLPWLSLAIPPLILVPLLFFWMMIIAYCNSHRSWAWGLYFVTFLTWFIGSLFAAKALDNGLGGI